MMYFLILMEESKLHALGDSTKKIF